MDAPDEMIAALGEQQDELSHLLAEVDDAGWQRPSRCAGWTVADVVLHLAQTNELAVGSARGRFFEAVEELSFGTRGATSVDDAAAVTVDRDRGGPPQVIHDRWLASVDALREALLATDPHERVTWVAGELSVLTLTTTRLAETWIHTGDVASAFGNAPESQRRLRHIARLAWRTLPYAFAQAGRELRGPVAFELTGPDDEPWDFTPDSAPVTTIRGDGLELCLVAARRADPTTTSLTGEGPDARAVLELVRTYA